MKIIILMSLLSVATFAKTSKVIYIPNTSYNSVGNPSLNVDNYFNQGENGVTMAEFGLAMQFLPFESLKFEASVDYKVNLDSPLYLSGKFIIPLRSFPDIAIGAFNIGITSETLKPIYYFLLSTNTGKLGKFLIGAYLGDKGELRDDEGEADNKGLLAGYEIYLNPVSKNLYFGADYFMGENIMSAVSLGIGWKFAKNVIIKFSYHIKLKKETEDLLGLQVNINTF